MVEPNLSVLYAVKELSIARSTYYAWPDATSSTISRDSSSRKAQCCATEGA